MAFREVVPAFPFGEKVTAIWYYIVDWENRTERHFQTLDEKTELIRILESIISKVKENSFNLYGVWSGTRRTDIFRIPLDVGLKKLRPVYLKT